LSTRLSKLLGGLEVVEIDETKYFKSKYNRERMLNRQYDWVFGMLERGTNKVRLFNVADYTAAKILSIVADNMEVGNMIISYAWSAYGG
jgi:hypothetical protein